MTEKFVILDGAMGTMLQNYGLETGKKPEALNVENPELIKKIHREYLEAGAEIILANTFGANGENVGTGVKIAKEAANGYSARVALSIGPVGQLLEPMGSLKFDDAYEIFKNKVIAGVNAGADIILIETMTDLYETKCAILAAKENSNLPVFCTMSFEKNLYTFSGTSISAMALTLEGLGVNAIGFNCSVGPREAYPMVEELTKWTNLPIIVKLNAGLPEIIDGKTIYNVNAEEFSAEMAKLMDLGAVYIGGCCGTTPEFIGKLVEMSKDKKPVKRKERPMAAVCSGSQTVLIDRVRIIGERINPTGKKEFQKAFLENNIDYIVKQAVEQISAGADILDVNVGLPGISEAAKMAEVIRNIQSVASTPLQIDSSNPEAISAGLRAYNGKAIVNSVNGDDESLDKILPVVKKYGASVIGLTLSKEGIPKTAEERLCIAEKILKSAEKYGISKENVFIDCLTLTSGAEQEIAYETIKAVKMIKEKLGVKIALGVSNISFGLPERECLNQVFLALALANGLDLPIINPNIKSMTDTVFCYHQLKNIDKGSGAYVGRFTKQKTQKAEQKNVLYYVKNGLKEEIRPLIKELLVTKEPISIVNDELIPALDVVGREYENCEIFLPQLLRSAETARSAFDVLKKYLPKKSEESENKIILATVKGDVHDIGKNIVKVVLENYGYKIIDLGNDVSTDEIYESVVKNNAKLVGLSALMTTTVENMSETIKYIKKKSENVKIMVGGAVLTGKYAKEINADFYAKDAMEAVAIAKNIFK